ncbi:hypothetical protein KKPNMP14_24610 [Klebsiella pneumoniae subsp. pneumoniae MP14]|nr:hypothetical protein KKPNMP14_24610 [Klebsiella pneumoniae subsp. pneumoniae MP14]
MMLQLSPMRPRLRAMGQGAWQSGSFFMGCPVTKWLLPAN